MNHEPADNSLREKVWRHELTPAEQAELRAWLAAHPEEQADWETEKDLSRLLARLPDAPVPSNFTARVLQAVEREERAQKRTAALRPWWLRVFVPRVAAVAVVISVGFFSYQQYRAGQRTKFVEGLVAVTEVKSLPSAEALEDFETILRLTPTPAADEELVSLMAKLQ